MYLHEDTKSLAELVAATTKATKISQDFVYKDYFVCMALKEITAVNSDFVFKGGTALSKCYGIIDRFSEDVDLGLNILHPTEGMRKKTKGAVLKAMEALSLSISNLEETRSRREFNKYLIPLPQLISNMQSDTLIIETGLMTSALPSQVGTVISFIGDYLLTQERKGLVEQFGLERFEVNVVALERTFADKTFAIADYYLNGEIPYRQSRHLYDLYKLEQAFALDAEMAELMKRVYSEREGRYKCASASSGVSLPAILQEIYDKQVYRQDYENVTQPLLYERVDYVAAVSVLPKIIAFLNEYPLVSKD